MVSAEAAGELDGASGGEAVGIAAVQFEGGAELSDEGGLPADLEVQLSELGGEVPARVVHACIALADRADEEGSPHAALAQRVDPDLISGQKDDLGGSSGGAKQQSETENQKSVRLSHFRRHQTGSVSPTWEIARAETHPRILLRRQNH